MYLIHSHRGHGHILNVVSNISNIILVGMRTQPIIEFIVRSPLLWENIREGSFIYFPFDCLTDLILICINLNQFIVHHWTVFKPLYTSLRVIERGISVDIDLVIWSDKSITHLKKTIAKLKTRQYFDKEHILSGILCSLSCSWSLECYATAAIFYFYSSGSLGRNICHEGERNSKGRRRVEVG